MKRKTRKGTMVDQGSGKDGDTEWISKKIKMIDGWVKGDKRKDKSVEEDIGLFQTSISPSVRTNGILRGWPGQTVLSGRCQLWAMEAQEESVPEAPAVAITAQWAAGPEQSGHQQAISWALSRLCVQTTSLVILITDMWPWNCAPEQVNYTRAVGIHLPVNAG